MLQQNKNIILKLTTEKKESLMELVLPLLGFEKMKLCGQNFENDVWTHVFTLVYMVINPCQIRALLFWEKKIKYKKIKNVKNKPLNSTHLRVLVYNSRNADWAGGLLE